MNVFKKCTCCGFCWSSRQEFLQDSDLELVGYQVNFDNLALGYFLFNHLTCQSTIAIAAGRFADLYDGPVFAERLNSSDLCSGYCQHENNLHSCTAACECAYVREILQIVRHWPKDTNRPAKIAQNRPAALTRKKGTL